MTQALYEALYAGAEYRAFSPGEACLPDFFARVPLAPDDVVLDIGCGTGRATAAIAKRCRAVGVDFVKAVETDIDGGSAEFVEQDLRGALFVKGSIGYCCDVMEHIAPEDVGVVLRNIMEAVGRCYFQICTVPDTFGDGKLHLTVQPFWWWAKALSEVGIVRYAREERAHAVFVVQRSATVRELQKRVEITEPQAVLERNIRANLVRGYREAEPLKTQATEVDLLAGGPSLALYKPTGRPVLTVNGAYNWALERGIKPKGQFVVDPRELNIRFVQPAIHDCLYYIGSQCHPSLAASLPRDQVRIWHGGDIAPKVIQDEMKRTGGEHTFYPVFGGSTVMLRTLPLLAMLGIRNVHIFGFDSCLVGDEHGAYAHHAYAQAENDTEARLDVTVGGRRFACHPWMAVQAQEFVELAKHMLPEDMQLEVNGDGLIAHILRTGAHYQRAA